ncbi:MAG: hypothetical protein JMN27_17590 [gamma proteobacterium endosymbiont of Lamellibrachia anaximandri]|nr:hypothetical protein [gamma proteobacterium endosymbiont of Lamellibrachia anaximandri]MBL3535621.1 hypothetical protein [gamma proteobacterium endosymbiont of Lamellibrachia anaximandri]
MDMRFAARFSGVFCASLMFLSNAAAYSGLVGSLEGEAQVSQGTLDYTLPVDLPQGPNGLAPGLSISYSPRSPNGVLGIGFKLTGESAITRCPANKEIDGERGGVGFDNRDRYCLDGQRLIAIAGQDGEDGTEYRTVAESYARIESHGSLGSGPGRWVVWSKQGYILEYGDSSNTRTSAAGRDEPAAWKLSSRRDRFDNRIQYHYRKDGGLSVPDAIEYSVHRVEFEYESRPDNLSAYQFGERRDLGLRLASLNILSNGEKLREYRFSYEIDETLPFSRISAIQLCDGLSECSPATRFEWNENTGFDFYNDPSILTGNVFSSYALGDLNQDGLTDLCYLDHGLYCGLSSGNHPAGYSKWADRLDAKHWHKPKISGTLMLLDLNGDMKSDYCIQDNSGIMCGLSDGQGFNNSHYWTHSLNRKDTLRFSDINSDGYVDICSFGNDGVSCVLNRNGKRFGPLVTLSKSGWPAGSDDIKNSTLNFTDINGDSLIDICGADDQGFRCALGLGVDADNMPLFGEKEIWSAEFGRQWANKGFAGTFRYGDLNADGLSDICFRQSRNYTCAINTGNAFTPLKKWADVTYEWGTDEDLEKNHNDNSLNLLDINVDGRADVCSGSGSEAFSCALNNGEEFDVMRKYASLKPSVDVMTLYDGTKVMPKENPLRMTDINNDGSPDVCYRSYKGINCTIGNDNMANLLAVVTTGYGARTEFEYGRLSDEDLYERYEDAVAPVFDMQGVTRVVRSISSYDGIGGMNRISYHYAGLKTHKDDGSLGFAEVSSHNHTTNRKHITRYYQLGDFSGRVREIEELVGDVVILRNRLTYREMQMVYDNVVSVQPHTQVLEHYELDGSHIKTEQTNHAEYDEYGNALRMVVEINGVNGDFVRKETNSDYRNDESAWLIGKPLNVEVTHSTREGTLTRSTGFDYDHVSGVLRSEVIEPGSSLSLPSEFEYDEYGNRTGTVLNGQGVQPRRSSTTYDSSGRFPIRGANALGHEEAIKYDPRCGLPVKQTGPNGISTHWGYDTLCRKTTERRADGTETHWAYEWSDGASAGVIFDDFSVYRITESATGAPPKTVYYDALNREVRTVTRGFNGKSVYQDKQYNAKGQIIAATLPYFEGEFPGANAYWVTSEYDEMGRVVVQNKPSETGHIPTYYSYQGLTTTVIDPEGRARVVTKNLLDKDSQVVEAGISTINYTYDPIGNLIATDTNGFIIRNRYDNRGNKVSMDDPSMGHWTYRYNAYGELMRQQDAKGQVVKQSHDLLGRMVRRETVEGVATWEYDTAANGIGKLAKTTSSDNSRSFEYDALGRAVSTKTKIGEKSFTKQVAYDAQSRPVKETFPDGIEIERVYNQDGYLKTVRMPKKQVWDYDYVRLEESLSTFLREIYKLEGRKVSSQRQAAVLVEKSKMIRALELAALEAEKQAENDLVRLETTASKLLAKASHYQNQSDYYAKQASRLWRVFGNAYFKYSKSSGGKAYYKYSYCSAYGRKGKCASYGSTTETVSSSWLPKPQDCDWKEYNPWNVSGISRFEIKVQEAKRTGNTRTRWVQNKDPEMFGLVQVHEAKWCESGPPKQVRLSSLYSKHAKSTQAQSERLSKLAAEKNQEAEIYRTIEQNSRRDAELYARQAKELYLQAREQTGIAREFMDKIEDYQVSMDTIERQLDEHNNSDEYVTLWSATSRDASGRLKGEFTGNGYLTQRIFDPYSGRLKEIKTGVEENDSIRNLHYSYDNADNVTQRDDRVNGINESYLYDSLDRLEQADYYDTATGVSDSLNYSYDTNGNILHKSNAGSMSYDQGNRILTLNRNNGTYEDYAYDANGNMVSGSGREIEWTSFNKPTRIKTKDADVSFEYGPDNNRVTKQSLDKEGQETTWYIGKGYELIDAVDMDGNHIERKKHSIYADGEVIAIQVRTIENGLKQADQTRYLHKDALGSVDTITDSHGALIARMGYTPFGQRRAVNGQEIDQSFQRKVTNRGYTGHEQIDNIGLVHMNARLYDPEIGRFLSADIYIQEPGLSQNFNRYIYVMNNPLKYNDPSGHFINFIIGAIIMIVSQFIDNPYIRMIGMVVGMAMMGGVFFGDALFTAAAGGSGASGAFITVGSTSFQVAAGQIALAAMNGAAIGAVVGGATTGTLKGAVKGAFFGAISGAAAGYIGHGGNGGGRLFDGDGMTALAHGVSQGAISEMRGGKFKSGFVGAFVASMSPATRWAKTNAVPMPIRTMTAAVLGGLASAATGGSFSDGAYHGAMVHLFNAELGNISNGDGPTKLRYESRTANGKVFRVPVYDVACNSTCASSNANVVWSDPGSQGWAHAMAAETGRDLASLVGNVASLVVLKTPLSVVGRSAGRLGDAGSIVKSLIVQDATAIIPIFTGKAASSYLQAGGWGASSATRFGTAASAVQGEYLPQ